MGQVLAWIVIGGTGEGNQPLIMVRGLGHAHTYHVQRRIGSAGKVPSSKARTVSNRIQPSFSSVHIPLHRFFRNGVFPPFPATLGQTNLLALNDARTHRLAAALQLPSRSCCSRYPVTNCRMRRSPRFFTTSWQGLVDTLDPSSEIREHLRRTLGRRVAAGGPARGSTGSNAARLNDMPELPYTALPTPTTPIGDLKSWRLILRCAKCNRGVVLALAGLAAKHGAGLPVWRETERSGNWI